jgi:hypothetical protein
MYPVVTFGFPPRRRCERGAAPGFSQNHEVDRHDRRFGALGRGVNGQSAPARPWPDEKRLKVRVGREWTAPHADVADPRDASDCRDDDRGAQDVSQRWRLHQRGAGRIVELIDRAARV